MGLRYIVSSGSSESLFIRFSGSSNMKAPALVFRVLSWGSLRAERTESLWVHMVVSGK